MDLAMKEINESLVDEWGTDGEEGTPSHDWPFKLEHWGSVVGWELYRFDDNDGVNRYAGYAEGVGVISGSVAGMTLEDITDEFRGGEWLLDQRPVDLNDADADEDDSIPPYSERLEAIENLVYDALGDEAEFWILRGYYLRDTEEYIAIAQKTRAKAETIVVGSGFESFTIGFRKASPERRLAIAIARHLMNAKG